MLQVITPTGDRPEAWKLCQHYMARQDYAGQIVWHVVDDGRKEMPVTFAGDFLRVHRLSPMTGNSQARNMWHLLEQCSNRHPVVVWEDDDWYSPEYLSTVARWLEYADLVGESHARYYNVATGQGKRLRNAGHASLCATSVKGAALLALRDAVTRRQTYLDLDLWQRFKGVKELHKTDLTVGIKGLPGRGGIGGGHSKGFGQPMDLRDWIGEDAELYGRPVQD